MKEHNSTEVGTIAQLTCEVCGHVSGAPFTARAHAKTHEGEEVKPKKTAKKAK